MKKRRLRYISLCSGVESATLAFEPLGFEPVVYAEVDEFPSAVLAARFPDVPNLGDITKIDWKEYHGAADLVVAGFPCQPYSVAGLRKGLAEPRGQIMLECLAACRDIDPEWIILENVPGLLSSHGGRDFETLLNALAILWPRCGCSYRILDARWWGLAQRRRRLFVVVNTRDWRRAAEVLLEQSCLRGDSKKDRPSWEDLAAEARDRSSKTGEQGGIDPSEIITTEPVVMASAHANAELGVGGVSTTLLARQYKDPPILFEERREQEEGDLMPIVIDRAAFNQGKNALYPPHIEEVDVMDTLVARGPHAVAYVPPEESAR